jgi:hypothetical protein
MTTPGPSGSYAIVPVYGTPPSNAIVHGSWDACFENIPGSVARTKAIEEAYRAVADAEEAEERKEQALHSAREANIRRVGAGIADLGKRLDALEAKRREHARKDAEEEERAIRSMLDQLPDPDDPTGTVLEQDQQQI